MPYGPACVPDCLRRFSSSSQCRWNASIDAATASVEPSPISRSVVSQIADRAIEPGNAPRTSAGRVLGTRDEPDAGPLAARVDGELLACDAGPAPPTRTGCDAASRTSWELAAFAPPASSPKEVRAVSPGLVAACPEYANAPSS